jgi:hypothetical protein
MATRFVLALGGLLFLSAVAHGQIKVRQPVEIWPELQLDYNLDNRSFFFFRNEYRHSTDPTLNTLRENSFFSYFNRVQVQVGYESAFTEMWSGGTSGRYVFERDHDFFITELFLRHTGRIGSLRFLKRGSFEHFLNVGQTNSGRFRLLAELERIFEISAGKVIRPRVSYELFQNTAFAEGAGPAGRNIDRTRLRFDLSFEVNRFVFLSPYFTRQTDYFVLEPQFDGQGNVTRPGGKHNFITPVVGLGMRYNFYQSPEAVSSRHR